MPLSGFTQTRINEKPQATATSPKVDLLEYVELLRIDASRQLARDRQSEFGQYMTPAATARLMASMFEPRVNAIRLLDAGAGVGSLTAAFVNETTRWKQAPTEVSLTAYEIDRFITDYLRLTLEGCLTEYQRFGITSSADLRADDFIAAAVTNLRGGLIEPIRETYNFAILNPPYRKISSASRTRRLLSTVGVETSNLYTAFLSLAVQMLEPGGQLVAITPRSFCNGPYFRPFRESFLDSMTVRRVHVFESRERAFSDDGVLQENVIIHAIKDRVNSRVHVSSSIGPEDELLTLREVPQEEFVNPGDPNRFMHIVPDEIGKQIADRMNLLTTTLADLDVEVSTGRVVDFRATEFLRAEPEPDTVPLIYPTHFSKGYVEWPKSTKKPNALISSGDTEGLLTPNGTYVLVKRFSSKEERRRIVAAIYDPSRLPSFSRVAFENHLNYYHSRGAGLDPQTAKGLCAFLNATLTDSYFRHFNGHTQVNATDLRNLKYPTRDQLHALGTRIAEHYPNQDELDAFVQKELFPMPSQEGELDPMKAKRKIEEALIILKSLGFPRQQQNERSALTLLSLLDMEPETPWTDAKAPLKGITQMMTFFSERYGKTYAPNSRETVRRQTVHQFVEAGVAIPNPDKPSRPTNSGQTVYQIEPNTLNLIRTFGTSEWEASLRKYLTVIETLSKRYAQERAMERIPLELASGINLTLSPGGQNVLVEKILTEFCERFTPGGHPVYVGDTEDKWAYFDEKLLAELGVKIESHGKMPDVVVLHTEKNWLILIEAVTSHGPVNPKRRNELKKLFEGSRAGLVFVTAFLDRKTMAKYLDDISWETEVWVAEYPDHLVHFNGERFLGPYEESQSDAQ